MEVLAGASSVEPNARICSRDTFVEYVTEQCPLRVLAYGMAKLETEPEVGELDRDCIEPIGGEVAQQQEPARGEKLGPRNDSGRERRQRKVIDA